MARVTRKTIEEYRALDAKRRSYMRRAEDLAKQQKRLGESLKELVDERGGKSRRVETCGHAIYLEQVAGQVAWKAEYVALAGPEAAEELAADPPLRDALRVEPL